MRPRQATADILSSGRPEDSPQEPLGAGRPCQAPLGAPTQPLHHLAWAGSGSPVTEPQHSPHTRRVLENSRLPPSVRADSQMLFVILLLEKKFQFSNWRRRVRELPSATSLPQCSKAQDRAQVGARIPGQGSHSGWHGPSNVSWHCCLPGPGQQEAGAGAQDSDSRLLGSVQ